MIGELQYDKHGVSFLASKLKLFGYIPAQPVVFVCYPLLLFLQLSFSKNGLDRSSEEKEKVAET